MVRFFCMMTAVLFFTGTSLVAAPREPQSATGSGERQSEALAARASKITGMNVVNDAGKSLGSVKDLVVDVKSGNVRYAVLSYGGFLGVGNKLFAVPWYAFKHHRNVGNDSYSLLLNIDEEHLRTAPGFDSSNWPDFSHDGTMTGLEKHYSKHRVNEEADFVVRPEAANKTNNAGDTRQMIYRASQLMGATVRNHEKKDLGTVKDLVISMNSGKVRYAALSYGGFLGLGDKLFAVPWNSFEYDYSVSDQKLYLVWNVSEEALRNAPGFNESAWPNFADAKYGQEIDTYYERTRNPGGVRRTTDPATK